MAAIQVLVQSRDPQTAFQTHEPVSLSRLMTSSQVECRELSFNSVFVMLFTFETYLSFNSAGVSLDPNQSEQAVLHLRPLLSVFTEPVHRERLHCRS